MQSWTLRELRALTVIAAPLAVTQLSQLIMALSATFLLGRLDSHALAAGGLCAIVIQALTVVGQGLVAGAQPLLAAARGAEEAGLRRGGEEAVAFAGGMVVAILFAALAVLLLLELPALLAFLGVDGAVVDGAARFVRFSAWALPAILWIAPLRFYLSVSRRAWVIMAATGCGAVLYVLLLYLLIFGKAGFPALGIAGAGIAFSLVWWAIAGGMSLYMAATGKLPRGLFSLRPADLAPGMVSVFRIGWPIALIYAAEFGLTIVISFFASRFGTVAIVSNQIVLTLNSIAFNPVVALGQAATIRVAYHVGARQPAAARSAGNVAILSAVAMMACFDLVLLLNSGHLVSLFIDAANPDRPAIELLSHRLLLVLCAFLVFDGVQAVASGTLRGLRDTRVPMMLGLAGYWLVGLPVAFVSAFHLGLGPVGIWLGILSGITSVACMLVWRWQSQSHRKDAAPNFAMSDVIMET